VAASSQIGFRFFGNFLGYKISFVFAPKRKRDRNGRTAFESTESH